MAQQRVYPHAARFFAASSEQMHRFMFIALVALVLIGLSMPLAPARAAVFIVNTAEDVAANDDGICDATRCSLREAIELANNAADLDTIEFDIPLISPSIQLESPLPFIENPV